MSKSPPPTSKDLTDCVNAKRFVPSQKLAQWDQIPTFLLAVPPRGTMGGGAGPSTPSELALQHWLLEPHLKRSQFDCSVVNILQYIHALRYREYDAHNPVGEEIFQQFHGDIQAVFVMLNNHRSFVENLKLQFESTLKESEDGIDLLQLLRGPLTNVDFDLRRIIRTTPEVVARMCDEVHTALHDIDMDQNKQLLHQLLTQRQNLICKDYTTRLGMLMEVEKLQSHFDLHDHDLYSIKFDCLEIAPPIKPHDWCDVCNKTVPITEANSRKVCAYHMACMFHPHLTTKKFRLHGKTKASIIKYKRQFNVLKSILFRLHPIQDRIVGHLTVSGIAENRPRLSIGDLIKFRFGNGGSIECIGEVAEVEIKTEKVLVFLPCPCPSFHTLGHPNPYITALSYPHNKPHGHKQIGRFDVRFGLFGSRSFNVFHSVLEEALKDPHLFQLNRLIAPTPIIGNMKKKRDRRLQIGISDWVTNVNLEQKQAVFDIVRCNQGSAPYIIYGPPGTGKTMTVVESIIQVLRSDKASKVLVCAPSDAACDVIAKRLLPILSQKDFSEHKMLRLNWWSRNPSSLPPELLGCSPANASGFFTLPLENDIKSASIIICQCVVAFSLELGSQSPWMADHFTHVLIDECSQSFEYEALIPLLKVGKNCSVVLAGDPKQLGPTIRSTCAGRNGLSLSLQERLTGLPLYKSTSEYCVMTTLLNNYRSHNSLLQIPSQLFYEGTLQCKASSEVTSICKNYELLHDSNFPLLVYDVSTGREMSKLDTPSFYNIKECKTIVKLINSLLNSDNVEISTSQIAVITCFRAQVLKLREILRENNLSSINVGVVEDFQGQEMSVIFISAVLTKNQDRWKAGSSGGLGFMSDPKRFNVAITRASALCVIVGSASFLESTDSYWSALIQHARRNSSVITSIAMTTSSDDLEEDYGISQFISHVEELELCLGAGHEDDRYDLAMRGYYQDAPEWRVCL